MNLSTLSTLVHPPAESVRPPHSPLGVDRRADMDKSEPQVDEDQPDLDLVRPNPDRTHCGCGNELKTPTAIWSGKCKPCRDREEASVGTVTPHDPRRPHPASLPRLPHGRPGAAVVAMRRVRKPADRADTQGSAMTDERHAGGGLSIPDRPSRKRPG
jgi:hypothetical protein